jgi:SNF2 family DNA or RNA helicase
VNEAAAKHGTKLAAVVRKLQELGAEDTTTKVILFVQFDDLKRKVAVALADFGIPAVQLHGSVAQRSNIINDWQNNPNSQAFVLLLSLAQSASGANLTAAGHVVFLHPMLAPSAETAIGYELQAIGRARRHGQKRNTVHVHRFVTVNTIEQSITERHQAALWERESARREKELANDRANTDENVDDFMADLPA